MRLLRERRPRGAAVLCYHRVGAGDDEYLDGRVPATPPGRLEEHLRLLRSAGLRPMAVGDLLAAAGRGDDTRDCVGLSFDDGFRPWMTGVLPLLKKEGVRATFYLVEGSVGADRLLWHHRLYRRLQQDGEELLASLRDAVRNRPWAREGDPLAALKFRAPAAERAEVLERILPPDPSEAEAARALYLSGDDVRTLAREGMEIGCHGRSHASLPTLDGETLRAEVVESQARLRDLAGTPVSTFSYPFGGPEHRTEAAESLVRATYASACVTDFARWTPDRTPHRIPRLGMADTPAWELAWLLAHPRIS